MAGRPAGAADAGDVGMGGGGAAGVGSSGARASVGAATDAATGGEEAAGGTGGGGPGGDGGAGTAGAGAGATADGSGGAGRGAGGASSTCEDAGRAGKAPARSSRGRAGAKSSPAPARGAMVITPPHTEQRARTDAGGILAGSTRKTERHSGQETFTRYLQPGRLLAIPRCGSRLRAGCRYGGRSSRPTPGASWRSSSFRLRVH